MTNSDSDGLFDNDWEDRGELAWTELDWQKHLDTQEAAVRDYIKHYDQLPEAVDRVDEAARRIICRRCRTSFEVRDGIPVMLLDEALPLVEAHYRVAPQREQRAITGLSMGGYGALKLAFKHPQLFAAVGAVSPMLEPYAPAGPNAVPARNRFFYPPEVPQALLGAFKPKWLAPSPWWRHLTAVKRWAL